MKANEETAKNEAAGFIHGERKEKVENTLKKVWKIIKKDKLSISQARFLSQRLAEKIKTEQMLIETNTTIE